MPTTSTGSCTAPSASSTSGCWRVVGRAIADDPQSTTVDRGPRTSAAAAFGRPTDDEATPRRDLVEPRAVVVDQQSTRADGAAPSAPRRQLVDARAFVVGPQSTRVGGARAPRNRSTPVG